MNPTFAHRAPTRVAGPRRPEARSNDQESSGAAANWMPVRAAQPVIRRTIVQTDLNARHAAIHADAHLVLAKGKVLARLDTFNVAANTADLTPLKSDGTTNGASLQGSLAQVLLNWSIHGVLRGGSLTPDTDQVDYPAEGPGGFRVKSDGNMGMAFHNNSYAFGHYSYNTVQPAQPTSNARKGGKTAGKQVAQPTRVDNEHFTVENSLATMFGGIGVDPSSAHHEGTFPPALGSAEKGWWKTRPTAEGKGTFMQGSESQGFAGVDNINFRPRNQEGRALSALPQQVSPNPAEVKPGDKKADPVAVEQNLTLQNLYDLCRKACAKLKLAELWTRIQASMETVRAQMGVNADALHLNSAQRREFLKLALTINKVATLGLTLSNIPNTPADLLEFRDFHLPKSPIVLTAATKVEDKTAMGFITTVRAKKADGKAPDGSDTWLIKEGENDRNYNEISTALITRDWETIRASVIGLP